MLQSADACSVSQHPCLSPKATPHVSVALNQTDHITSFFGLLPAHGLRATNLRNLITSIVLYTELSVLICATNPLRPKSEEMCVERHRIHRLPPGRTYESPRQPGFKQYQLAGLFGGLRGKMIGPRSFVRLVRFVSVSCLFSPGFAGSSGRIRFNIGACCESRG